MPDRLAGMGGRLPACARPRRPAARSRGGTATCAQAPPPGGRAADRGRARGANGGRGRVRLPGDRRPRDSRASVSLRSGQGRLPRLPVALARRALQGRRAERAGLHELRSGGVSQTSRSELAVPHWAAQVLVASELQPWDGRILEARTIPEDPVAEADESFHDREAAHYDGYLEDARVAAVEGWLTPQVVELVGDGTVVDL